MKRIITLLTCISVCVISIYAQVATKYRMNVITLDGNVISLNADSVVSVNFTTDSKPSDLTNYSLSGHIEKGPFVSGSSVVIQPVDEQLYSLGGSYSVSTKDNLGSYEINIAKMSTPYVKISATGYYFDECYSASSTSKNQITLIGFADLSKGCTVNINMFTHLKYYRMENLVKTGMSLSEADAQAQKELLTVFGLQRFNDANVNTFSIIDGGDKASILIVQGMMALHNRHSDSQLSSYLSALANDFADDGKFTDVNIQQIKNDKDNILNSIDYYSENLTKYYANQGKTITYPSLYKYMDWDNNGTAGDEIYDGTQSFSTDKTEIDAPKDGGTYAIHISSSVPVYTYDHSNNNSMSTSGFNLINNSIIYTTSISNSILTVTINPTTSNTLNDGVITLYDIAGNKLGGITLKQKADPNGTVLTNEGKSIISDLGTSAYNMTCNMNYMDSRYTGIDLSTKYTLPLNADDTNISSIWTYAYQFNAKLLNIKNRYENSETSAKGILEPMIKVYNVLLYTRMINLWGDVPYVTDLNMYEQPRTSASTILNTLSTELSAVMPSLYEAYHGNDSIVFPCKDVARDLMADIDMTQGDYNNAMSYLKQIETSDRYNLANDNSIVILSFSNNNTRAKTNSVISFLPNAAITYTDVILKLAECEHHTGDDTNAQKHIEQVAADQDIKK